jgi:hypothetical protein
MQHNPLKFNISIKLWLLNYFLHPYFDIFAALDKEVTTLASRGKSASAIRKHYLETAVDISGGLNYGRSLCATRLTIKPIGRDKTNSGPKRLHCSAALIC